MPWDEDYKSLKHLIMKERRSFSAAARDAICESDLERMLKVLLLASLNNARNAVDVTEVMETRGFQTVLSSLIRVQAQKFAAAKASGTDKDTDFLDLMKNLEGDDD